MRHMIVRGLTRTAPQGKLHLGAVYFPCALGRSGCGVKRHEGDGVTPIGRWPVHQVFYRADRVARPRTNLPVIPIRPWFGWCDAPGDANYNRFVQLPYPASCERLWRDDSVYDIVAVLGFNDVPRAQGRGSAIFLHIARDDYAPTEGCVALARPHLLLVLELLGPGSEVIIF